MVLQSQVVDSEATFLREPLELLTNGLRGSDVKQTVGVKPVVGGAVHVLEEIKSVIK